MLGAGGGGMCGLGMAGGAAEMAVGGEDSARTAAQAVRARLEGGGASADSAESAAEALKRAKASGWGDGRGRAWRNVLNGSSEGVWNVGSSKSSW